MMLHLRVYHHALKVAPTSGLNMQIAWIYCVTICDDVNLLMVESRLLGAKIANKI